MRKTLGMLMLTLLLFVAYESRGAESQPSKHPTNPVKPNAMNTIKITVGSIVFRAKLHNNEAANAWLQQMPITVSMPDLNGNEKYYRLAQNLPSVSTEKPSTIKAGELMCWSGNTLVLFYKTFPNTYGGYVRLGHIEPATGLAEALGSGTAQVSFALDDNK